jgi:cytochrome c
VIAALALALVLAGDAKAGEALYERCAGCHSIEQDRAGPRHCGLFGRRAGGVPGFEYSEAMKRSGLVWSAESLDRFLANPDAMVPGTPMSIARVASAAERADLVAYLRAAADPKRCRTP